MTMMVVPLHRQDPRPTHGVMRGGQAFGTMAGDASQREPAMPNGTGAARMRLTIRRVRHGTPHGRHG